MNVQTTAFAISLLGAAMGAHAQIGVVHFSHGDVGHPAHRSVTVHRIHPVHVHARRVAYHRHPLSVHHISRVHFRAPDVAERPAHHRVYRHIRPVPTAAPAAQGNLVEPLSNHFPLSSTSGQVRSSLGTPPKQEGRLLDYPGFAVQTSSLYDGISEVTVTGNVRMHCGIGVGSTRSEVRRFFGISPTATSEQMDYGKYHLGFLFDSDGKLLNYLIAPRDSEHGFRGR